MFKSRLQKANERQATTIKNLLDQNESLRMNIAHRDGLLKINSNMMEAVGKNNDELREALKESEACNARQYETIGKLQSRLYEIKNIIEPEEVPEPAPEEPEEDIFVILAFVNEDR